MRRNRSTMKKERIIMLVSSVFVLTALTMTGFYVKEKNEAEKDGYVVDMSALEKKTEEKTKEIAQAVEEEAEAGGDTRWKNAGCHPPFPLFIKGRGWGSAAPLDQSRHRRRRESGPTRCPNQRRPGFPPPPLATPGA